jgi:hypothetical protein
VLSVEAEEAHSTDGEDYGDDDDDDPAWGGKAVSQTFAMAESTEGHPAPRGGNSTTGSQRTASLRQSGTSGAASFRGSKKSVTVVAAADHHALLEEDADSSGRNVGYVKAELDVQQQYVAEMLLRCAQRRYVTVLKTDAFFTWPLLPRPSDYSRDAAVQADRRRMLLPVSERVDHAGLGVRRGAKQASAPRVRQAFETESNVPPPIFSKSPAPFASSAGAASPLLGSSSAISRGSKGFRASPSPSALSVERGPEARPGFVSRLRAPLAPRTYRVVDGEGMSAFPDPDSLAWATACFQQAKHLLDAAAAGIAAHQQPNAGSEDRLAAVVGDQKLHPAAVPERGSPDDDDRRQAAQKTNLAVRLEQRAVARRFKLYFRYWLRRTLKRQDQRRLARLLLGHSETLLLSQSVASWGRFLLQRKKRRAWAGYLLRRVHRQNALHVYTRWRSAAVLTALQRHLRSMLYRRYYAKFLFLATARRSAKLAALGPARATAVRLVASCAASHSARALMAQALTPGADADASPPKALRRSDADDHVGHLCFAAMLGGARTPWLTAVFRHSQKEGALSVESS